jgi:hypothetical protein
LLILGSTLKMFMGLVASLVTALVVFMTFSPKRVVLCADTIKTTPVIKTDRPGTTKMWRQSGRGTCEGV